jgi:hypothetical protein
LGNVAVAPPAPTSSDSPSASQTLAPQQPSPASIIVSQNPGVGQKVLAGTTVNFEVR